MSKPNFFIIGGPKCGTTAIDAYLRDHAEVFMCTPKDTNYFSEDLPGIREITSEKGYEEKFADANKRAVGESSSLYMFSRVAVPRIAAAYPEAKLIAMVRNPLALLESFHAQLLYSMEEDEQDIEKAWELQAVRAIGEELPATARCPEQLQYREVAMLGAQLKRVYDRVPREQVHVIVFDDLASDTARVYRETLDFLNLPDDGRTNFEAVNVRKEHRSETIGRFTEQPPTALKAAVSTAKRVIGVKEFGLLNRVRAVNDKAVEAPGLRSEFRAYLADVYRDDVALLGDLIERDLSHWVAVS